MRKLALFLLFLSSFAYSQSTTVTITAMSPDGQVWSNGRIRYIFLAAPGKPGESQWQGAPLPNIYKSAQSVPLDVTGTGTFTVPSNTAITPVGSTWNISVCPNATTNCVVAAIAVTGPTTNLSSFFQAQIDNISVGVQPIPKSYSDTEIQTVPNEGGMYYNTGSTPGLRYWDGTIFHPIGGGGSGTVSNFSANSGNWPTWLAPTVNAPTSSPDLRVSASPIPNAALANSQVTINSTPMQLGGSYSISATATPGGANTNVQFNNSGIMGGTNNLTTNSSTGDLVSAGSYSGTRTITTGTNTNCAHDGGDQINCNKSNTDYNARVTTNGNEGNNSYIQQDTFNGGGRAEGAIPFGVGTGGWTVPKGHDQFFNDNVRGIGQAYNINSVTHSIGDKMPLYIYSYNDPGCGMVASDEGCGAITAQLLSNPFERRTGTLTGGTATNPILTVNGPFTDGGYLMDVDAASSPIATAFNGTGACCGASNNWQILVTASSIPVSTGVANTNAILPVCETTRNVQCTATVAVTNRLGTLVVGYAEIAGPVVPTGINGTAEMIHIDSVSGGNVTISYNGYHASGAGIYQGGVAGYGISVDDDLTLFGYRTTYVALGSFGGTDLIYCAVSFGTCNMVLPRPGETAETSHSAIHLYKQAEVVANFPNGTVQLEPNPWFGAGAVGHAIEGNPPYFSTGAAMFLTDVSANPCTKDSGGCSGLHLDYGGPKISDAYVGGIWVQNSAPCSMYVDCDAINGKLAMPIAAIKENGYHQYGLTMDKPLHAAIRVNDPVGTGTDYSYGLLETNSAGWVLALEANQTGGVVNNILPGQSSAQVRSTNFQAPCLIGDASIQTGKSNCNWTIQNIDGAGSPDLTLNQPTNGSAKLGLVANAEVQFNNAIKTPILSAACVGTNSSGYFIVGTCSGGGGGLGNGLSTGVNSGNYSALSWNGLYGNTTAQAIVSDTSGADKHMYYMSPTTSGGHYFRINNVDQLILDNSSATFTHDVAATDGMGVPGATISNDPGFHFTNFGPSDNFGGAIGIGLGPSGVDVSVSTSGFNIMSAATSLFNVTSAGDGIFKNSIAAPIINLNAIGSTYRLNIEDSGQNQARIATTSSSSYAAFHFVTPSQDWQVAVGGSGTGGNAGQLYFYDQTAGHTSFAVDSSTGNGSFLGKVTSTGYNQPLSTPSSSSDTCTTGDSKWDASFVYICTATNTWKRAALSTF